MSQVICDKCKKAIKINNTTIVIKSSKLLVQKNICKACTDEIINMLGGLPDKSFKQKITIKKTDKIIGKLDNTSKEYGDLSTKRPRRNQDEIYELIKAYGIEKAIQEYTTGEKKLTVIAREIGIQPVTLKRYFNERGEVKPEKPKEINKIKLNSSEDFNIDKVRYNKKVIEQLTANEVYVNNIPEACRTCAYNNKEIGYCWYTMVTDKQSMASKDGCSHFVDIRNIQK